MIIVLFAAGAAAFATAAFCSRWKGDVPNVFVGLTVLCIFFCAVTVVISAHNNKMDSQLKSIQNDLEDRKAIMQMYEDARESHDKHRLTSARAAINVWNSTVDTKKRLNKSIWLGIFYGDGAIEALERIDL